MDFKEYLNESLIVEAKVKVGGKEFLTKREAGLFLARQGKTAEEIVKLIKTTLPMAKWFVGQVDKKETTNITRADKKWKQKKLEKTFISNVENKSSEGFDRTKHQKELQRQIDIVTARLNSEYKHGLIELEKNEKRWPKAMNGMYAAGAIPSIDGNNLQWESNDKYSSYPNLSMWSDNLQRPEVQSVMDKIETALKDNNNGITKLYNSVKDDDDPRNDLLRRFLKKYMNKVMNYKETDLK